MGVSRWGLEGQARASDEEEGGDEVHALDIALPPGGVPHARGSRGAATGAGPLALGLEGARHHFVVRCPCQQDFFE